MMAWKWAMATAAAVLSAVPASAVTYDFTIQSEDSVPAWQMSSNCVAELSIPGDDIMTQQYSVSPLAPMLGFNQTQLVPSTLDIDGDLVLATETSYVSIAGSDQIAFLSCDNTSSSFIDANTMFNALLNQQPAAILLYSEAGVGCRLSTTSATSGLPDIYIFTMLDRDDASQALNFTQSNASVIRAEIMGNSSQVSANEPETGTNNSAIAMNVLYSITGLVTLLFLIIIATGAIRAHRNPERYGPRSGLGGRPRQSRAKGLARAVLETLPIVKFGDPTPAKPDPNTELESIAESRLDRAVDLETAEAQVPANLSSIPENAEAAAKSNAGKDTEAKARGVGGVGSADATPNKEAASAIKEDTAPANHASSAADDDDHLGCSICTEDFAVGEDVRVLPCDHKFHPHCVDPWLVNVSGTCPLCRLDLRPPNNEEDEPATDLDDQLPMSPPLEEGTVHAEQMAEAPESNGRRRSSRLFDLHRLRHAPVEERIEALRRYRAENQAEGPEPADSSSAVTGGDDERSRATLTKRLRDKFRIRTRAQSPDSSSSRRN